MDKIYDFCILITTYNRPDFLKRLLDDINNQKKDYNVLVAVFNDGSNVEYDLSGYDVKKIDIYPNMGKKKYYNVINKTFEFVKNIDSKYFIYLPDDINLVDNFFEETKEMYIKIDSRKKICLNILTDDRVLRDNWGYPKGVDYGDFYQTQWNDLCFICEKKFFESLDYKIYDIPLSRWSKNPNLSSGVGHQITDRLNKKKFFLYHTKKSMVIHGDHESKMNYTERLKTKLVTKHNFDLSIIVPTYKNTNYLDECINSLVKSTENYNVEILIGVDGCKETMDFIKGKKFPKNITFFYFNENEGPYSIKNTLTSICNSKNLLFFDSDDISEKELVSTIINNIDKYDCIKPKYKDFGVGITPSNKSLFGEGVFAITKELFLNMNGFEPWMCAADSDFMGRLYKRKCKILHTPVTLFKRRIHDNGLTSRTDTGLRSPKRFQYQQISKSKKGDGNPKKLNIRDFKIIDHDGVLETFVYPEIVETNNEKCLVSIFNKEPKIIEEVFIHKKQKVVSDNPLFNLLKNKEKVTEVNIVTEQRKNVEQIKQKTKRQINEEFNPPKPNRRLDLPRLRF